MSQPEYDVIPFDTETEQDSYHSSFQRVLEQFADVEDATEREQLSELARIVYDRAQPDFFDRYTPDDLAGYLRHLRDAFESYGGADDLQLSLLDPTVEDHGWDSPFTVFTLVVEDLPFVVDSLYELFRDLGLRVRYAIYNPVYLEWDDSGALRELEDRQDDARFFVSFHLDRVEPERQEELRSMVRDLMADLEAAVDDFEPMIERARSSKQKLQTYESFLDEEQHILLEEGRDFIRYLIDGNFVFLGYRSYSLFEQNGQKMLQVDRDSGLGILRNEEESSVHEATPLDELDETYRERMRPKYLLVVSKAAEESRIYRRERLDYVGVKQLNEQGDVVGEDRFVGLFTNRVLAEPAVNLPLLRQKFEQICRQEDIQEHSHTYRDFYSIFNGMPKHVLFMTPVDDIIDDIRSIISVHGETKFKLRARPDLYQHGISLMVLMSKDRFNQYVRQDIQEILQEEFEVDHVDYRLSLSEGNLARLHFHLNTDRRSPRTCSFEELEHRLFQLTRTWTDNLQETLNQSRPKDRAHELFQRYEDAFPTEFQALVNPELALNDLENFEQLRLEGDDPVVDMIQPEQVSYTHLIVYSRERIRLSDLMPMLTNHGLIVLDQSTFQVDPEDTDDTYHYHLFRVQGPDGQPLDLERRKSVLLESIRGVLEGTYRDDQLNQLVTLQGFTPNTLNLFRLYKNYFHQLQPAIKLETINRTLVQHSDISRMLYELFVARFRPDGRSEEERQTEQSDVVTGIEERLDDVEDRTDDLIIRSLLDQVTSTVRTNFFQSAENRSYISVKVTCREVEDMPEPRPKYEIFVYSPYMEATHLRGGDVARGGIRWSDRRDDYRTEVLGLMKTQMVKNSLIVPVGSKGGFVLKTEHLSDDRDLREHAREQYKNFMRGMLDLTDNIVEDSVVHPENVVCYDGDDPYLVVAADKGTAHLSDTANSVAAEYDFWLGDAFASGGSVGYDHKELGITARGAWECVKRHFRERDVNLDEEVISVVGIGDMSGDVFGNGMILSDNLKLRASFNHLHIFLDPDPDPEASYRERKRLFEQALGWDEYDESVLSDGGAVFSRQSKTIELSEPARTMLGLPDSTCTPAEAIRALLTMDVDLLWNGGIGTYIKHSDQNHADVGDPANDRLRVDAPDVRADVIGEGGNLGITQRGRIELDQTGVSLNTDAIDNSGGVDLSDHEVNLKILLQEAIREDELEAENRESTLMDLTDSVVEAVTRNNYRQSGAISLESCRELADLEDIRQLLNRLEESVELDRAVEALPDERTLQDRELAGEGITRPELAVLMSYTKMDLYEQCKRTSWDEEWVVERFLRRYFPDSLHGVFPRALDNHPLRLEIALTQLVNYVVDYTGVVYFERLSQELARPIPEIVRGYLAADDLVGAQELRLMIGDHDYRVDATAQYRAQLHLQDQLANCVSWLMQSLPDNQSLKDFVSHYKPSLEEHKPAIMNHLGDRRSAWLEANTDEWKEKGFDEEFSRRLAELHYTIPGFVILQLAEQSDQSVDEAAELYFSLGSDLNIDWIMQKIFTADVNERWDQLALRTLTTDIRQLQKSLSRQLLMNQQPPGEFLAEHEQLLSRLREIRERLEREQTFQLSAYHFMVQRIRSLLEVVEES